MALMSPWTGSVPVERNPTPHFRRTWMDPNRSAPLLHLRASATWRSGWCGCRASQRSPRWFTATSRSETRWSTFGFQASRSALAAFILDINSFKSMIPLEFSLNRARIYPNCSSGDVMEVRCRVGWWWWMDGARIRGSNTKLLLESTR